MKGILAAMHRRHQVPQKMGRLKDHVLKQAHYSPTPEPTDYTFRKAWLLAFHLDGTLWRTSAQSIMQSKIGKALTVRSVITAETTRYGDVYEPQFFPEEDPHGR